MFFVKSKPKKTKKYNKFFQHSLFSSYFHCAANGVFPLDSSCDAKDLPFFRVLNQEEHEKFDKPYFDTTKGIHYFANNSRYALEISSLYNTRVLIEGRYRKKGLMKKLKDEHPDFFDSYYGSKLLDFGTNITLFDYEIDPTRCDQIAFASKIDGFSGVIVFFSKEKVLIYQYSLFLNTRPLVTLYYMEDIKFNMYGEGYEHYSKEKLEFYYDKVKKAEEKIEEKMKGLKE